jgi:uncharacterized YccA/Bax inhibitor family protein
MRYNCSLHARYQEIQMAPQLNESGNPVLGSAFRNQPRVLAGERMTLQGAVNKSFLLLVVLMAAALWPWSQVMSGDMSAVGSSILLGAVGGLIVALIISFNASLAPYLAVPYAALEGLAIGGISASLERRFPGIAIQAVALTFGVLGALLVAYKTRIVRVTERFRAIVIAGTMAIALVYVLSMVLGLFHIQIPFLFSGGGTIGILISLAVIVFAALNLVLDFDLIAQGVAGGAPRYMEWYAAFGLLVTLVWLYLEILRLLTRLRER